MSIDINSRPEFLAGILTLEGAPADIFEIIYREGGCLQPDHGNYHVSYPEPRERAATIAVRATLFAPKEIVDIQEA